MVRLDSEVSVSRKTLHQPEGEGFPMAIIECPCSPGVRVVQLPTEVVIEQGGESITITADMLPTVLQELMQAAMCVGGH